jgi:uncharacterized protein YggE
MSLRIVISIGVLAVSFSMDRVAAQTPSGESGTVSGVGTVSVKRRPEFLRVKLEVFAAGKTIKEAIANLKDRREAIRGQLATLAAVKDSIVFGEPQVNSSVLEARQRMEMMIRNRMGKPAKKEPKKGATAPTVVSASLTAEWSLKGQDTEALLIEVARIREAITAADLSGRKDLDKLGSDDEELKEEMEGLQTDGATDEQGRPQAGAPAFLLVSKVTAQEQAKALAEAFQKARARAHQTAKAAGAELGALRQLDSQFRSSPEAETAEDPAQAYYRVVQAGRTDLPPEPDAPPEAQGAQPGAVTLRVIVTASFALKETR